MKGPESWNACGTIFQAVFISCLMLNIQPWRCFKHIGNPYVELTKESAYYGENNDDGGSSGGKLRSVATRPDVLCEMGNSSGDENKTYNDHGTTYSTMIVFMFIMFLPILFFIGLYMKTLRELPVKSLRSDDYYRNIKFMIYRFHPGTWYYGLVLLSRNCAVSFSVAMNPERPFRQAIAIIIILISSGCFAVFDSQDSEQHPHRPNLEQLKLVMLVGWCRGVSTR